MRIVALTLFALVAFAANSLLCRLALGPERIDAASFTTVRLVSGAAVLAVLAALGRARAGGAWRPRGTRAGAAMLFGYAACFSFAYVRLDVGTGALLLFGAVQATMIAAGLGAGERPCAAEWLGTVAALVGLVTLVAPGLTAPPAGAALLMLAAGIAWGIYSLRGRGAVDPLVLTAGNFAVAALAALALSAVTALGPLAPRADGAGITLALASGVLASGLGYVAWYAALPALTATRAATVQLTVPLLAAASGVLLLGEVVTARLVAAAVLILGGVGLALAARRRRV